MDVTIADLKYVTKAFESLASSTGFRVLDAATERHGHFEWSALKETEGARRTVTFVASMHAPTSIQFQCWAGIDTGKSYSRFPIGDFWVQRLESASGYELEQMWYDAVNKVRALASQQAELDYATPTLLESEGRPKP